MGNGFGWRTSVDSRSIITALLGLAFIASHNLYLFAIKNQFLDVVYQRAWYSGELFLFIVPLIWMGNYNHKTEREIQFRKVIYVAVSVIMLMITLNAFNFIPLPYLQVYYFNGITFAYTLYALIFSDNNGDL